MTTPAPASTDTRPRDGVIWTSGQPVVWTVAFGGDFVPGPEALRHGAAPLADRIRPALAGASSLVVNLEGAVDVDDLPPVLKSGLGSFLAMPPTALDVLRELRAEAVGLANNHIYDYGIAGFERTEAALSARHLRGIGTGRSLADEPEIALLDGPSGPIAVWAAASRTLWPATLTERGVEVPSPERASRAVAVARAAGAQTMVAFVHAGLERSTRPSPDDVELMAALAESGFDLVVACHSHLASGYAIVERSDGGTSVCFYGLGSLVSSALVRAEEYEGLIGLLGLDAQGRPARIAYETLVLDADGVGEPATGSERDRLLGRVEEIAREVSDGTYRAAFYRDTSSGFAKRQLRDARAAIRADGLRGMHAKVRRLRPRHLRTLLDPIIRRLR